MRIPPPVLALTAALVQRALARDARSPNALRVVVAAVTTAGSGWLASSAARQFQRAGTTLDPMDPARASVLVTTGVNAITRNPMYVGLSGLLVAHAVLRGSWAALLPAGAFVAALDRLQVLPEEAALSSRFGPEYDAYRARVPRWLGPGSVPGG